MKSLRVYVVTGTRAAMVPGSTLLHDNIVQSLERGGHSVVVYQFEKEAQKAGVNDPEEVVEYCTRGIVETFELHHRERPFDLAFCMVNDTIIRPEALKEIAAKTITVNYTTNYHQFQLVEEIAKYVTLSTYISLPAREAFERIGAKSYWMPMAANPDLYRTSDVRKQFASFVGTAYGERPYYMWRLLQRGVDLRIHGPGWKQLPLWRRFLRNTGEPLLYMLGDNAARLRFINRNERRLIIERLNQEYPTRVHGPLSDVDMANTFATSRIVINIAESRFDFDFLNPMVLRGCNFRDFEAPMSGACLFTQQSAELEHFYEPGREVVVFHDDIELADKLQFYGKNLAQLEQIASFGRQRALSEHTWEARFGGLFRVLGIA